MIGQRNLRAHCATPWDDTLPARHFGGPKIPPPPPAPKIELPPPVEFSFEAPEFPSYDFEGAERRKEEKRQKELNAIVGRRSGGRYGTIKNKRGAAGLEDEPAVQRPGLIVGR